MHSRFMDSGKVIVESPGPRGGRKKSDITRYRTFTEFVFICEPLISADLFSLAAIWRLLFYSKALK